MTLPSDFDRYEVRYINRGSTFNTTFTAADDASWNAGTANKIRVYDLDLSNLTEESVPDPSVQQRFDGRNPPLITRRTGSIKFKMHMGGGSSDITYSAVSELLGAVLGGKYAPASISDTAETGSTATQIVASAHGYKNNMVMLINGESSPIEDEDPDVDTNKFDLQMDLSAAPANGDTIKAGHTIFIDETDETYLDWLIIGSHTGTGATDNPDQVQCIGTAGIVTIGGLTPEETPFFEFEFMVGDWQFVENDDKASFSYTEEPIGEDPVSSSCGYAMIQDSGTTTRNETAGGNFEIEIGGYELVPIMDHNNCANSVGGWKKVRLDTGPRITMDAYWANLADMPGLQDDFRNGTKKQVLLQFGASAQNSVTFYMQKAYLQQLDPASRVELERNTALKLIFEGAHGEATNLTDVEDRLEDASFIISFN